MARRSGGRERAPPLAQVNIAAYRYGAPPGWAPCSVEGCPVIVCDRKDPEPRPCGWYHDKNGKALRDREEPPYTAPPDSANREGYA